MPGDFIGLFARSDTAPCSHPGNHGTGDFFEHASRAAGSL